MEISYHEGRDRFQHFSHEEHPLSLILDAAEKKCEVCDKDIHGSIYGCSSCMFFIHESCDERSNQILSHQHPLELLSQVICKICNKEIHGPRYGCDPCEFYIHESCCELQEEICHPFHPAHKLILQKDRSGPRHDVYGEFNLKYYCRACRTEIEGFCYQCADCEFDLHLDCASVTPRIKYEGHEHLLILVSRSDTDWRGDCDCCFAVTDIRSLCCVQCDIYFHIQCDSHQIPPTIESTHHGHPLKFTTEEVVKDDSDLLRCDICYKERSPDFPFYNCAECDYSAHAPCVVTEVQLDKRERLRHFNHKHALFLSEKENNGDILCSACDKGIQGLVYGCDPCSFYLHKICAELPRERHHPFHEHPLNLEESYYKNDLKCNACFKYFNAFNYCCSDCDFYLDLNCASRYPSVKLEGHEHMLTHFEELFDFLECKANCKITSPEASYLRCVRCNYNVHLLCSPLPDTIKHTSHQHSLALMEGFGELDCDEYHCNVCKTEKDTQQRVYFCAECCYVANLKCMTPEVMRSLKGETFNKVGYEGTHIAGGERKKGEIETRNYFLHEHPLTLCENDDELLCVACGSPFLAEEYGCSKCHIYVEECFACNRALSGSFYVCKLCWPQSPIFHKSCVELPQDIQISGHPQHSIHLVEGFGDGNRNIECCFCNTHKFGSHKFCCYECSFQIHFECAAMLINYHEGQEHTQHFSHRHPLSHREHIEHLSCQHLLSHMKFGVVRCSICNQDIHGPSYACAPCEFYLHESCSELQQEIHHVFHPAHSLILQEQTKWKCFCSACLLKVKGFCYRCDECDFNLHSECVSMKASIKYEAHQHLLAVVENMSHTSECNTCCHKIKSTFFVRCMECDINFHVQCDPNQQLPPTITDKHHGHQLTLTKTVVQSGNNILYCAACKKERNPDHPFYFCAECDYSIHVRCLNTEIKFNPEELILFSHKGPLILQEKVKSDNIICSACEKDIDGTSYGCKSCSFYLHKLCAELPRKVIHPFHPHYLSLPKPYCKEERECNACHKYCYGFTYHCSDCDFDLDLDCVLLQPSIKYEGHGDHILTLFEKLYDIPKCIGCPLTPDDASYLRCVICNFNVHFWCSPLPITIEHWSHQHSLSPLYRNVDENYDTQICDVCETERDPGECVYYCEECDFIAECNCVIDEVLDILKVECRDVPLEMFKDKKSDHEQVLPFYHLFNYTFEWDSCFEDDTLYTKQIRITEYLDRKVGEDMETIWMSVPIGKVVIFENPPYSDEDFTHFIIWLLNNRGGGFRRIDFESEFRRIDFVDDYEEVIHVKDYMITRKLAPVIKNLMEKYGDFTSNCTFTQVHSKSILLNWFCGVVESMCNTKIMYITDELMCHWWRYLKIVQGAGFSIDFALNHLKEIAYARYREDFVINQDSPIIKVHEEMDEVSRQIDNQNAKMQQLKERKRDIARRSEISRLMAERLDEAMELAMKNADTGLL